MVLYEFRLFWIIPVLIGLVFCSALPAEQAQNLTKGKEASGRVEREIEGSNNGSSQAVASAPRVESRHAQAINANALSNGTPERDKDWLEKLWQDPISSFTALLFIATVLLWWATRSLVKGAEKASEMQLRAYVHVKRAGATRNDGVIWANVEIQNFGQTPAYDVVQWIGIVGVSEGDIPNISKPTDDLQKAKGILAPGNHTNFLIPTHDKLTTEKEAALRAGKATIYVFGEITYRDIFKKSRTTKFKMFLSGEGTAEGLFKNCEDGNDAT